MANSSAFLLLGPASMPSRNFRSGQLSASNQAFADPCTFIQIPVQIVPRASSTCCHSLHQASSRRVYVRSIQAELPASQVLWSNNSSACLVVTLLAKKTISLHALRYGVNRPWVLRRITLRMPNAFSLVANGAPVGFLCRRAEHQEAHQRWLCDQETHKDPLTVSRSRFSRGQVEGPPLWLW